MAQVTKTPTIILRGQSLKERQGNRDIVTVWEVGMWPGAHRTWWQIFPIVPQHEIKYKRSKVAFAVSFITLTLSTLDTKLLELPVQSLKGSPGRPRACPRCEKSHSGRPRSCRFPTFSIDWPYHWPDFVLVKHKVHILLLACSSVFLVPPLVKSCFLFLFLKAASNAYFRKLGLDIMEIPHWGNGGWLLINKT